MNLFLGLYTGAACDGIDAVIISIDGKVGNDMTTEIVASESMLMPDSTRRELLAIAGGKQVPADHMAKMSQDLAGSAATMGRMLIASTGIRNDDVTACGWSGFEVGRRDSCILELTDQALLAHKLSMPVVSGFIASDIAAGGKGCGISAWCDWQRFRDNRLTRAVVNLGGLAEMIFIPADAQPDDVIAGHVGPGTCVIDDLTFRYQHKIYDTDGSIASSGKVVPELLNTLQAKPFFHENFPRSTSLFEFSPVYLFQVIQEAHKFACTGPDLIATMTELTAWSVAKAVESMTERPH
ncbi:MAG TPA: anhydro-N-acetylmuramic acid kinase, partial [Phycisphaerae bacterium]|nr:anhydro-N-acetylmuramic acid kinase [Phycisphaerae bacterium]